jgi:DNA-binding beta-propeller fold protein YncE
MLTHRNGAIHACLLLLLLLLTSCTQSANPPTTVVSPPTTPVLSPVSTVTPTPTSVPKLAPARYISHLLLRGVGRPDDLAFDQQGRLLFSDEINGTISRVNADGSVTLLVRDSAGPEGIVVLPDGTFIYAEQESNRIVSFVPGAKTPTVLRVLPGTPSNALCKHGVDGIALDPTTNTLIVSDSPTGAVYRMSLDGKTFTLLANGIVRPVGAGIDNLGDVYIADECGNAIWRIAPSGKTTRIGGFGMPDDVVPDGYGNVLVIDLQPDIHALIRLNLATGKRETLARQGFIEPQGLVIDLHGNIYVADDYANIIVKYTPA